MSIKTLICGLSGTGKSTSARNLKEVAVVNPVNKPLPFRNSFEMLNGVTDSEKIKSFMRNTKAKVIIVDDFQYLLSIPYMRRIKETGWDKYNDFASNYFEIITVCDELPADVTVYFMTHTETLEDGTETVKLIGKLLREKICIEGLFTTVLKTMVNDGKYYFITQNNGHDNVKSPLGMFDSYAIDNDLAYVDAKIRNYYNVSGAVSDEVMADMDAEAKTELEPPKPRSERKRRNSDLSDMTSQGETTERKRRKASDIAETVEEAKAEISEAKESAERGAVVPMEAKKPLKERKSREEVVAENDAKVAQYMEAQTEAIAEAAAEDETDVAFEAVANVPTPELEPVPRRRRRRSE